MSTIWWGCDTCGKQVDDVKQMLLYVTVCDACYAKLNEPIRLDGCVTAGSWQSIVDAHMQAHSEWRERMVQLAKDICSVAG